MPIVVVLIPAVMLGTQSLPTHMRRGLISLVFRLAKLTFPTIFFGSTLAVRLVYNVGGEQARVKS